MVLCKKNTITEQGQGVFMKQSSCKHHKWIDSAYMCVLPTALFQKRFSNMTRRQAAASSFNLVFLSATCVRATTKWTAVTVAKLWGGSRSDEAMNVKCGNAL